MDAEATTSRFLSTKSTNLEETLLKKAKVAGVSPPPSCFVAPISPHLLSDAGVSAESGAQSNLGITLPLVVAASHTAPLVRKKMFSGRLLHVGGLIKQLTLPVVLPLPSHLRWVWLPLLYPFLLPH